MWDSLNEHVFGTWISGGPLMVALAILAFIIYASVLQMLYYLMRLRDLRQDVNQWEHWVEKPEDSSGLIGDMIRYTQRDVGSREEMHMRFHLLRRRIIQPLDRQLKFGATIVTAAPLLGLLGTVIGMLSTFLGLSVSYGGNSLDLVAGGISEALITTQTGLMLAIPAMFFLTLARSQRRGLQGFLAHLEAQTIKVFEKRGIQ
ncbi:MotA/TolQ/ExbB proton channel family protein [Coraliomargarita parva]|uniref:MotA/TolQ/ExbB proton channel family protein n=1 Tax=Coraliomargarita parva TaxID=3014050 RepID=UPI0022B54C8D|nr:MotA/TolQ/ExbB proton channel family protein [Coraliomargarita parva]